MITETYENFPWRMVATANAVGLGIYAFGLFLMLRAGAVWGALYAVYCAWMEWRLLSRSCRTCYYYGKRCGFGRGVVCSWFFSKSMERTLREKPISWLDIVPDFLVPLIPLAAGVVMLIRSFSWPVLFSVLLLLVLGSIGTGMVRARIACRYCKQRALGCPAEQLFSRSTGA